MGQVAGYSDWSLYKDLLIRTVRGLMPKDSLRDAVQAAAAWKNSGPATWSRLAALRDVLSQLSTDRPKTIVFAGFPGAARQIHHQLKGIYGDTAVASFRAEQLMEEKEANALRFQHDAATWLLVSDETGGEGRNFQFAVGLIHVDTPWQAARIEQRIGRLDRLGREKFGADVISHVLYCDASVEAGLVHCLDVAIGVYDQSISGLEFALRDIEAIMVSSALGGGTEQMIAEAESLTKKVARERERDDAEAVLDEASYESSAASRFGAIARTDRVDAGIETAMLDYMRQLTEGRGVRRLESSFGAGAVVRFQPEQTVFGALPVDSAGTEFLAGHYDGTFRRAVAQQAPRLHFFNVSDPLFNAVINSLERHVTGRVFGIEMNAPGHPKWVGVECRFIPKVEPLSLGGSGLRNRIDALFIPKSVVVLIDLEGRTLSSPDVERVVSLRRRLDANQRGQAWWDLSALESANARAFDPGSWSDTVTQLVESARHEAMRLFDEQLRPGIEIEMARVAAILELLKEAAGRGDQEAAAQIPAYTMFNGVVARWGTSLDAVGIVSVNGRIRHGQIE